MSLIFLFRVYQRRTAPKRWKPKVGVRKRQASPVSFPSICVGVSGVQLPCGPFAATLHFSL